MDENVIFNYVEEAVEVGNSVFIAAGSTVTKDIPDGALAIARSYQINKDDYESI